jgi:hypothetical protein
MGGNTMKCVLPGAHEKKPPEGGFSKDRLSSLR